MVTTSMSQSLVITHQFRSWCAAVDHLAAVDCQGSGDSSQSHMNERVLGMKMGTDILQVNKNNWRFMLLKKLSENIHTNTTEISNCPYEKEP